MSDPTPYGAALTPLDQLCLTPLGGQLVVHPPAHYGIDPFILPPLPKSLADFLAQICLQFYEDNKRCLTMLLMLDCDLRSWGSGIPRQRAGPDGASWQPAKEDFSGARPHTLVAGSFQTRNFMPGDNPKDAVPNTDGVHLILALNLDETIHCFVGCGGKALTAIAWQIINNDVAMMIDASMNRITLV